MPLRRLLARKPITLAFSSHARRLLLRTLLASAFGELIRWGTPHFRAAIIVDYLGGLLLLILFVEVRLVDGHVDGGVEDDLVGRKLLPLLEIIATPLPL